MVLCHDSVSHRILRAVYAQPDQRLFLGQLLKATEVSVEDPLPTPLPNQASNQAPRSATVQIERLLASPYLRRERTTGARERLDGTTILQWVYFAGDAPLVDITFRPSSPRRPGMRVRHG
jgi:hypothetical protein